MTQKRSDALQALVAEVVDLEEDVRIALAAEEDARATATAARLVVDSEMAKRLAAQDRLDTTQQALDLIRGRDLISDETVSALRKRASRR